jgi:hypothetical protein
MRRTVIAQTTIPLRGSYGVVSKVRADRHDPIADMLRSRGAQRKAGDTCPALTETQSHLNQLSRIESQRRLLLLLLLLLLLSRPLALRLRGSITGGIARRGRGSWCHFGDGA